MSGRVQPEQGIAGRERERDDGDARHRSTGGGQADAVES
jgi:hypothetical protein